MAFRVDRPRFRGIFERLGLPREPSEELLDAWEDTISDGQQDQASQQDLGLTRAELLAAMNDLELRMTRMVIAVGAGVFIGLGGLITIYHFLG